MNRKLSIVCAFILFFFMLFSGCRYKTRHEVMGILSNKIDLPIDSMEVFCIVDSLYNYCYNQDSQIERELFMLIYKDRESCSSCTVEWMTKLKPYIDTINEKYDNRISSYFIFAPKKEQVAEMKIALRRNQFHYPVFFDTTNIFKRRNPQIPDNDVYRNFLIDNGRNVLLVGPILENANLRSLLYRVADSCLFNFNHF